MHVIALRGRHDSGKSQTLGMVYQLLLTHGYTQVPGHYQLLSGGADIYDVLTNGTQIVGVVSRGDVGSWLATDLANLAAAGCVKAVCACRLWGYTNTMAVDNYPNTYVDKTVAPNPALELRTNQNDANRVFALI